MSDYIEVTDDGEVTLPIVKSCVKGINGAGFYFACCDCGLIHRVILIPINGNIKMYMKRDKRRTTNHRRRKKLFKKR